MAPAVARCDRRTVRKWKGADPDLAAECEEAELQASEVLEEEARERATG